MVLKKIERKTLKEMEGTEIYYKDSTIGIEYPFIWKDGVKKKYSDSEWKKIYNAYWKDNNNEGYWLMKDAKKEFGGK